MSLASINNFIATSRRHAQSLCNPVLREVSVVCAVCSVASAAIGNLKAAAAFAIVAAGLMKFRKITADIELKTSANRLFTNNMMDYERTCIVAALGKIEAAVRPQFIDDARSLFTDDMYGYEKADIVGTLGKIEAAARLQFIDDARSLFTDDMYGSDRAYIVGTLGKYKAAARSQIIDDARSLFTDNMSGSQRARIIEIFVNLQGFVDIFGPFRDYERPAQVARCLAQLERDALENPQFNGYYRTRELLETPLRDPLPPL